METGRIVLPQQAVVELSFALEIGGKPQLIKRRRRSYITGMRVVAYFSKISKSMPCRPFMTFSMRRNSRWLSEVTFK